MTLITYLNVAVAMVALASPQWSQAQFKTTPQAKVSALEEMRKSGKISEEVFESSKAIELFKAKGQASGGTSFVLTYQGKSVLEIATVYNNRTAFSAVKRPGLAPDQFKGLIRQGTGEVEGLLEASLAISDVVNPMLGSAADIKAELIETQMASESDIYHRGYVDVMMLKIYPTTRDLVMGAAQIDGYMQKLFASMSSRAASQNASLAALGFEIKQVAIRASK